MESIVRGGQEICSGFIARRICAVNVVRDPLHANVTEDMFSPERKRNPKRETWGRMGKALVSRQCSCIILDRRRFGTLNGSGTGWESLFTPETCPKWCLE